MLLLKFNPYFTLHVRAPGGSAVLPFAPGERVFADMRFYLTTNLASDITVEFHGEPYETIAPRPYFAAWFNPVLVGGDPTAPPSCWVERASDGSRHLVELIGEENTEWIIEAVQTVDEYGTAFPLALTQVIRTPLEVRVESSEEPIITLAPAGKRSGALILSEVELVEER